MKSNKKIFVLFEKLENIHLNKDVGQLPMEMAKELNYDVSLLSCFHNVQSNEFEKYVILKNFIKFSSSDI
jgi:hypothetical protein